MLLQSAWIQYDFITFIWIHFNIKFKRVVMHIIYN